MSFFRNLFSRATLHSVALIDVSSASVGGGYALVRADGSVELLYSLRLPIEIRKKEKPETAMERTLRDLGSELARQGAPALLRASGSGAADAVLAAVSAPWQETAIRTEVISDKKPFVFSKDHIEEALRRSAHVPPGRVLVDESPISITLNGYTVQNPFGKKVLRAMITVLTSTIDETATANVAAVLRSLFHTREISLIAGLSLRFQALSRAFPHEKDFLILDASGTEISAALVRNGLLTATEDMRSVVTNPKRWPEEVRVLLRKIAEGNPLPYLILLIAEGDKRAELKKALDDASLGSLWLSGSAPTVIAVDKSHIRPLARYEGSGDPDLSLLLMALHARLLVTKNET